MMVDLQDTDDVQTKTPEATSSESLPTDKEKAAPPEFNEQTNYVPVKTIITV